MVVRGIDGIVCEGHGIPWSNEIVATMTVHEEGLCHRNGLVIDLVDEHGVVMKVVVIE